MNLEKEFVFINQYWQYIVAGIVCYLSARFFYSILGNKYNEVYGDRKENKEHENDQNYEDPKYKDDTVEDEDEDEDSDDMDMRPFIPASLTHVPLAYERFSEKEIGDRAEEFYKFMSTRRTVRNFSKEPIPIEIIRNIIRTAGTSPSGAHTEPWTYIVIKNPEKKSQIREIIEKEEEINYTKRMGKKWTTEIKFLKTNWVKQYLTDAPYLILVFKQVYSITSEGNKRIHYYNEMSVNIAVGLLLTAIHYAGLVSLTSTPLNCGPALRTLLDRPTNEKLIILLPVGYPAENCLVPDLQRKALDEILIEV